MCKKFLLGAIITAFVCMTACSKDSNKVTETSVATASESVSAAEQMTVAETETKMQETKEVTEATAESTEIPEYKYKAMLEKYILYMKKEHSDLFKNGNECKICLQDICGDDIPEMAIRILYQKGYSNEFFSQWEKMTIYSTLAGLSVWMIINFIPTARNII